MPSYRILNDDNYMDYYDTNMELISLVSLIGREV